METAFDFLTMAVFAGLIVLFLQRSVGDDPTEDSIWQYLIASVGCAVSNYLGNNSYTLLGLIVLVVTLIFIYYVLRPLDRWRQP
ncbi:hypothetical protein EON83_24600 [bacterium]|nr:MAG: hypothetical protein EON83_24600 [bacterium]